MVILRQETQLAVLRSSWTQLNTQRRGSATETIRVIKSEARWHQSSTSELSTGIMVNTKQSRTRYIKPQSKGGDQSISQLSYNCVLLTRSRRMGQRGPVTQTYMSRGRSERAGNSRPVTFYDEVDRA